MVARAAKGAVRGHETVAQKVVERFRDERASVSKGFKRVASESRRSDENRRRKKHADTVVRAARLAVGGCKVSRDHSEGCRKNDRGRERGLTKAAALHERVGVRRENRWITVDTSNPA
jgi:hypothetical protein